MTETITFLGTAGARIMVANQIQPSGGMWLDLDGTQILIDPGPGTIVHASKKKLRAEKLSAIVLSHRHLDHAGDMNIMVEAMTQGGFKPRGMVFAPSDAIEGPEPVLFSYLRQYLNSVEILKAGKSYTIGNVTFTTPVRHIHQVETYGMRFQTAEHTFSYIADGRYFEGLSQNYLAELVVMNVVFVEPRPTVDHLAMGDAKRLVTEIKPKIAILTHFGMNVWRARPWELAEKMTQETGIKVIAARAGMTFDLAKLSETKASEEEI